MLTILLAAVVGMQLPPPAPPRDAASARTGATASIAGRITERGTDRPLFRAVVRLLSKDQSQQLETLTDAQGRYEFTDIRPGDYALLANPGDHRSTHLRQLFGRPDPGDPFVSPASAAFRLAPGERRTGADMALMRALAISGHVLTAADEPMADVEVNVVTIDGAGVGQSANGQYTDDRGEFRVFGLPPGRYRVCAAAPNDIFPAERQATSRMVRTCYPAATSESAAADVIVEGDEATGIDIHMQRSSTYAVTGAVYDGAGVLVDGASVFAMPLGQHGTSSRGPAITAGRYLLPGLTPGRYLVRASIGGPANPSDTRPPAREQEVGYAIVDVEAADVAGVDLRITKGTTLRGRVVFDDADAPRGNRLQMVVYLSSTESRTAFAERPSSAAVDDALAFELPRVFRWPHVLTVQGLPDGWVIKSVGYGGRDIADIPTEFVADARPAAIEIHLTRRVATPAVRVTAADGSAAPPYQVLLLPRDPARWHGALFRPWQRSSDDGRVSLGPRLPGDYLLAAISIGDSRLLQADPARVSGLASIATPVTFVEGDSRTFDLQLTRLPAARQ